MKKAKKTENKGLEVKIWMLRNGLTGRKIARGYNCKDPLVSNFLMGKAACKGLVQYLISQGCPEEYFNKGRVAA